MLDRTQRLWATQDRHVGDRHRLFAAIAEAVGRGIAYTKSPFAYLFERVS